MAQKTDDQLKKQIEQMISDSEVKKRVEERIRNYQAFSPDGSELSIPELWAITNEEYSQSHQGGYGTPDSILFNKRKTEGGLGGNIVAEDIGNYPTFSVDGGRVKLTGRTDHLQSDMVKEAKQALKDYYKGYDLTNAQVAENIQQTIDEVNKQIKSNIDYQNFRGYLESSGFSEDAYRNYSLAMQEADPKTTTNLLKSKKKIKGRLKDGTITEEGMLPAEWINYYKKNWNPEERAKLWMDSAEALNRAAQGGSDDDLYDAIPFILMGRRESINAPAAFMNQVNIFNDQGWEDAKVYTPIYGFDDVNGLSVFTQAFLRQLGMRGLGIASDVVEASTNPWLDLGANSGGQFFGIDNWKDSDFKEMTREEYQDYAQLARDAIAQGFDTYEKMKDEYGEELAKKMWVVNQFAKTSPMAVGGGRMLEDWEENGEVIAKEGDYPGYKSYRDFQSNVADWSEHGGGAYKQWSQSAIDDMNKYIQQMATYDPNAAAWGIVGGSVASFIAEQAALGLISGGALTASNLASKFFRGVPSALGSLRMGQKVLAAHPQIAQTLAALAKGGKAGWEASKSLGNVARVIYTVGEIATWAVKEVGEDALRGLLDDVIMQNSLDSQGNLDYTKFLENVYMNAIMAGLGHAIKGGTRGLASLVGNAKTRSIDGVELNVSQRHELNLLQKALDDQNRRIHFRGWDENMHPVITVYGKTKVLNEVTASGDIAKLINEITGAVNPTAVRTLDEIAKDENVPVEVKQKIADVIETTKGGTIEDIRAKIQETFDDDEIRQAFPDGTVKVGDQTIRIDTKDFTAGDVGRVSGKEYKSMDEAIDGLGKAITTRDFASAVNGIMRYSVEWAKSFKEAVEQFAEANNMTVRDVMIAIRESRLAGQETIPGLKQLWDENWKPVQTKLLDLQEQLTGIRPVEHDFYFRDMLAGTYKPGENGSYSIEQGNVVDQLGGDATFDLAASSTARNTGKLGEMAPDKLEYDPEILAREYVASRMQTIWQSNDMGKIYETMQEAHDAGEFDMTEADAAKSVGVTKEVATEVGDSDGVKEIEKLSNVTVLGEDFGNEQAAIDEEIKDVNAKIKAEKDNIKAIKEETTYEWKEDGETVKKTLDDNIKDTKKQLAEQQAEVDSFAPKTDPSEVPKMDYELRNELAKSYAERNPEYIVAYRRQPKGVDKWYSNGTGTRAGNLDDFSSYGSDKGDLTDAVWLTTDEGWASGKSKASAGSYNGEPDQTVVVLIPKSSIVDGGGEQPLAPKGEGEFTDSWGNDRYTIRGFSKANDNKIVQTRATESEGWFKAREENEKAGRTPVTDAMRYRLNPDFYEKTELVLFRDTQPDIIENSNKLILEEYNSKHKVENEFFAKKAQRSVDETQSVLDGLLEKKRRLDAAKENLKNLEETKKKLQDAKTPEGAARAIDEDIKATKSRIKDIQAKIKAAKAAPEAKQSGTITVYRGQPSGEPGAFIMNSPDNVSNYGKAFFFIEKPKYASGFGENVVEFSFSKDKVVPLDEYTKIKNMADTTVSDAESYAAYVKENGEWAGALLKRIAEDDDIRAVAELTGKPIVETAWKGDETGSEYTYFAGVDEEFDSTAKTEMTLESQLAIEKKNLADLEAQKAEAANAKPVTIESNGEEVKSSTGKTGEDAVEEMATLTKKQVANAQKKFNESASKSNAAEKISRSSGYSNRGVRINPGPVVGVNYMPSNPFGKFAQWINDHFVKANSIKMRLSGYRADGTPVTFTVTAYNGGYKMYAEAGSFARNVIVDVQHGDALWDAIYKQVRNNGFFIEPSKNQKAKYGALTSNEQAAKITDKIMDKMGKDARFSHAFNDDGTVKDTAALLSILTTRFRSQGISDFTKFIRKSTWDSFTKGEQEWLNKRMYEMTASVNKKSFGNIAANIARFSMGLRYRSNMWFNYKNGQLQLTECQRLFTMNKIGDFGRTLKRLVSDSDYRQRVSDYTYILASESAGRGLTRADLDKTAETFVKVGAASTMSKNGMLTNIDNVKAKFGEIDDTALASIEGGEYAKNYILIAGFVAAGEKQGLSGVELDNYVRNRFNTEALAGTKVGRIGLTDSKIGQFAFMYLGFPIRELALQWHTIRGGGLRKDFLGSVEYLTKMLGAKFVMWAAEAPWGYSLMDQLDLDPFGWTDQYSQMPNEPGERTPFWGGLDVAIQYNPFFQGAMTSALADIYFAYRAAQETAREEYKAEHNGSAEGFEWSLADAGGQMWEDLLHGLTPGYTEYSRISGEISDLDRGYRISSTGNRLYEPNTDPGNIAWAMLSGRGNTPNAQDYYQTAAPIRGLIEGGLPGLGQNIMRANPFRGFREFDPADTDTYEDWFNGSYADQQNWNTGIYSFRDEAQQIKEKYDRYANSDTAVNSMASRENELSDLRKRVEKYVEAYMDKHPEGISSAKQNQIINIFNLGGFGTTLQEAFNEGQGDTDYTEWQNAKNRYSQGNFPTAYGLTQDDEGETEYTRSPQLEQVLSQQRYGIASDAAPMIEQMYKTPKFETPLGNMTMKDYHDKVYAQLQEEWDKSKPDYDKITKIQEEYLEQISRNVIQPILNTYGSAVLSAGKSSDIMQEFGKMLYSMVPSDEYRIDKKGKQIYKSTPYMTIDIPKWLNKNFSKYTASVNTTNRQTQDRLDSIRSSLDQGHRSTAVAKARALIRDIGQGKASVSRDELEWLQGVLND